MMKVVMLEREDLREKDENYLIKVILPEGEEFIVLIPEVIDKVLYPTGETGLNLMTRGHYE